MNQDELSPSAAARPWPRSLRVAAVTLWGSFVGGALMTTLLLVLAPEFEPEGHYSWHTLGTWFLCAWLVCMVPLAFGLMLASAPPSERDRS
jgi:drug/metabolite transporter (DMT)-like permease